MSDAARVAERCQPKRATRRRLGARRKNGPNFRMQFDTTPRCPNHRWPRRCWPTWPLQFGRRPSQPPLAPRASDMHRRRH
eukprot:7544810-Lingulodinium_polyedra.AAC.1